MNALVCFKTIADTALMTASDWAVDERLRVDLSFVRQVFNCFDESALELALRLSEQLRGRNRASGLTALTVDDRRADSFLRRLYAVGYDRAVRVAPKAGADLRFDPGCVSRLIAAYVELAGDLDALLTGGQSGEGDNRQTGFLLAERLNWPCIANVTGLEASDKRGCLIVSSRRDGRELIRTVKTPLVLVVGNTTQASYLRRPTLKQCLLTKKKPIAVKSPADLGQDPPDRDENDKKLIGLAGRQGGRGCEMIQGRDLADKVRRLYEGHLSLRLPR